MIQWIHSVDSFLANSIQKKVSNPTLTRVLGKTNRGEILLLLTIPILLVSDLSHPWYVALIYASAFAYLNDRSVLWLKKKFLRKRPLITVSGKVDSNPDMKHSFPSAHSSNSMTVAMILVFGFGVSPYYFVFSILSGIGRLFSLHHYLSDVVGGWIVGFFFGSLGFFLFSRFFASFLG